MDTIWPPVPHTVIKELVFFKALVKAYNILQVTSLTGPQSTANSIMSGHLAVDVGRNG